MRQPLVPAACLTLCLAWTAIGRCDDDTNLDTGRLRDTWIINQSLSRTGQIFYQALAQYWQLENSTEDPVLTVSESPMTRFGITIDIRCQQQLLSRISVGPQQGNAIRELARLSATRIRESVQRCQITEPTVSDKGVLQ